MTIDRACRVCDSVEKRVWDFLCQYQGELVAKSGARDLHAQRGGFCAFHTWQYNQMTSVSGVCTSHAAFLQSVGEKLLALVAEPRDIEELVRELERFPTASPACIICEMAAKAEEEALGVALSDLNSTPATNEGVPLLCFPHLVTLAARCPDLAKVRRLVERHGVEFRRVAEDMRQFVAKHDALRRNLLTDREGAASFLGLLLLAGRSKSRS